MTGTFSGALGIFSTGFDTGVLLAQGLTQVDVGLIMVDTGVLAIVAKGLTHADVVLILADIFFELFELLT
jgi:hypothetical protein